MLYAQTVMTPPEGGLTPYERDLVAEPSVSHGRIHNINLLEDGTLLVLLQLSGDAETVRGIAEGAPDVFDYWIEQRQGELDVYTKQEPPDLVVDLLSIFRKHQLMLQLPIEYIKDGRHQSHLVGTETALRRAAESIPNELSVELKELSEYPLEIDRLHSSLTETQQEILRVAQEMGYYQHPREATHADIAAELDRSDGTVGEHLRKIEARIMQHIVP